MYPNEVFLLRAYVVYAAALCSNFEQDQPNSWNTIWKCQISSESKSFQQMSKYFKVKLFVLNLQKHILYLITLCEKCKGVFSFEFPWNSSIWIFLQFHKLLMTRVKVTFCSRIKVFFKKSQNDTNILIRTPTLCQKAHFQHDCAHF